MKNFLAYWSLLVVAVFSLSSCDLSEDEKSATVQIWMTDAPGDFQEVNVDIKDLQIHLGDDNSESGWRSININKGIYNLLELTNGLDTLLGTVQLPAGKISQIRLVLGDRNTIKVAGDIHALETPSGKQSGLKIQVHETLKGGITYKMLLDFDAARSIVNTGSEKFILKPVIRSVTQAQDGAIKGTVTPKEAHPAVFVLNSSNLTDTLASTFADTTGHFFVGGLPAGSYQVVFVPATGYQSVNEQNVNVTIGEIADLGTVSIPAVE